MTRLNNSNRKFPTILAIAAMLAIPTAVAACNGTSVSGGKSPSYQAGYDEAMKDAEPAYAQESYCNVSFISANVPDKEEFMRGCMDGLNKAASGKH